MANKLKYKSPEEMQKRIDAYFDACKGRPLTDANGEIIYNKYGNPVIVDEVPLTVTGLALALGFTTRQALLNYQKRGAYTAIIETAKLKVENYAEMRLFDKDGMNGARFTLENNFKHWDAGRAAQDDKKAPAINIICDIPRTPIATQDGEATMTVDPQTISELIKDLERGGGDDG